MRAYIFAFVSIVYLLNFTLGIYEIPDNLPIIGHIDEFAASALLIYALQTIRKKRMEKKSQAIEAKKNG